MKMQLVLFLVIMMLTEMAAASEVGVDETANAIKKLAMMAAAILLLCCFFYLIGYCYELSQNRP